ncbi:MAG: hypothetical protein EPN22_00550 [Nitrospirae bacterium]|nr:MAG: hypothetical protein EPN22_00550 [Nitrospirota bacterium]
MGEGFSFRALDRRDLGAVVSLIGPLYKIRRPPEFFSWQLFDNVHPTIFWGAFDGEELAGIFGIQKRVLTNGLIAGQMTGVNIGAGWRGKGLLKGMGDKAIGSFNDLDMVFIFSNEKAVEPCKAAFGLVYTAPIAALELSVHAKVRSIGLSSEWIDHGTLFPLKSLSHGQRTAFLCGRDFRNWRYSQSPYHRYQKLSLDEYRFAVVKMFHPPEGGAGVGDIVDLECPPDDRHGLADLLHGACSGLIKDGAKVITTWALPGTELAEECASIGFTIGAKTQFGLRSMRELDGNPYSLDYWYFRQADATNY